MAEMDNRDDEDKEREKVARSLDKDKKKTPLASLMDKLHISMYGTSSHDEEIDAIDERFNSIVQSQINKITDNGENSLSSFLGMVYTDDKDTSRKIKEDTIFDQLQINSIGANPQDFFPEQYKNRMTKQAMAQEISEQLIELRRAKEIMAATINSADVTTGKIKREIVFNNTSLSNPEKDWLPVIEAMEEKFKTLDKIKRFITTNTLGYGEYYVCTMPYHMIFNDFIRRHRAGTDKVGTFSRFFEAAEDYPETKPAAIHPLFEESAEDVIINPHYIGSKFITDRKPKFFFEEELDIMKNVIDMDSDTEMKAKDELTELFTQRITVSEDQIPLPILEEGFDAWSDFVDTFVSPSGSFVMEDYDSVKEFRDKNEGKTMKTAEDEVYLRKWGGEEEGLYQQKASSDELLTTEDIKDCYIRLIPPTRMIPIKMMERTILYLFIQTSSAVPLSTILTYTTQLKTRDPNNKIDALVEDIATRIANKFSKKFISENKEFKEQIVAALEYYDLANTNIHFQAISPEYITCYKVNTDVDGNGHSMIEPSLFYANIYMSWLIFKIMTIFTKGNDRTVNYIRRSGIDKNLWNDVQDIIRKKKRRQITINDIFSYNNIVNKSGAGSEEFIPMTRSGDKPIETEVVQGQDVQLETPLMERIRSNYILGTNVPAAIMNFLNEADFAKSVETANTKMNEATVDNQIDMNDGHTDWYRKLLRFSTNVPEEVINTISFKLPEPKGNANIVSQELINNYQTLQEFIVKIMAGENPSEAEEKQKKTFIFELAKKYLSGVDFDLIKRLWDDAGITRAGNDIVANDDNADDNMMM